MVEKTLKIISWNVNGIRAILNKGFQQFLQDIKPDILGIQETKVQENQITNGMKNIENYKSFWSCAKNKKGYSGVCVYINSQLKPLHVKYDSEILDLKANNQKDNQINNDEGRIIEVEFKDFIFFNIYFPNGQSNQDRLDYKLNFYYKLFNYIDLHKNNNKNIIIAGDYNIAHNEIDLKNPKANQKYSGFLRIERDILDKLVENGYLDSFRYFYPDKISYSWWSYRFKAREKNIGWRVDYIFVTKSLIDSNLLNNNSVILRDAFILDNIFGSDHCPVGILLKK